MLVAKLTTAIEYVTCHSCLSTPLNPPSKKSKWKSITDERMDKKDSKKWGNEWKESGKRNIWMLLCFLYWNHDSAVESDYILLLVFYFMSFINFFLLSLWKYIIEIFLIMVI